MNSHEIRDLRSGIYSNKHLHKVQIFTIVTIFMLKHVNQHCMKIINFVSFNTILTFTQVYTNMETKPIIYNIYYINHK